MIGFCIGLALMCASTLMYVITLTRLLSVTCWYYLAFVSVSMAMFGMTAGALAVQLRPDLFDRDQARSRMAHAAFAMAASTEFITIVIIGGLATLEGPFIGAYLLIVLSLYLEVLGSWRMVIYGLIIVLVMLYARGGIAGFLRKSIFKSTSI